MEKLHIRVCIFLEFCCGYVASDSSSLVTCVVHRVARATHAKLERLMSSETSGGQS